MKYIFPYIIAASLFSACQTMTFEDPAGDEEIENTEVGSKTMYFRLTGINMTDISELTSNDSNSRSASTTKDVTDNLLLGIYNTDGTIVGNLVYQHRDDPSITYGTFSQTLKYGKYTILAIGWNGTQQCQVHSLDNITFSEGWVPNTFLCLQNIVVSESYSDTRTLSLKRCVARFKLTLRDEYLPEDISNFHIGYSKSGNRLNAQTKHSTEICDHTRTLYVNGTLTPPVTITSYCFLPEDSAYVDVTITANDSEGNPVESRQFTSVPMKINYSTNYSGNFFPYSSGTESVSFETEFDGEINRNF